MRHLLMLCVALALLAMLAGCAFGLRYDGDERGLRRERAGGEGGGISYLAAGDPEAPRLIFIHGSPGRASAYAGYLQDPPAGFEVIAVDRPGYGASRGAGPVTSMEAQAAAIAPLLVERRGRWPIVVGHSLGGPIACRLAADFPGRVGGLIVIGGAVDPSLERLRWYNVAADLPPVSVLLKEYLRVSNREMHAARKELELLGPRLGEITCPVTIIHGTGDHLVPFANLGYLRRRLEGAAGVRVVTLPGEDHFITRERPGVVRAEVEGMRVRVRADPESDFRLKCGPLRACHPEPRG